MEQDWEVVTVRRSTPSSSSSSRGGVRGGARGGGGPAPHYSPQASSARKLANATEVGKHKILTAESRHFIIARRSADGITQVQLNQRCAFPPNTIRDIESGRVCPSIGQLNTLNRILKCGLKLEEC